MDKIEYDQLYHDEEVIKYYDCSGQFYKTKDGKLAIGFFFIHKGISNNYSLKPERRITLSVCPIEDLMVDIPLYRSKNNFLVLANTGFPDYALTYRITINENTKSAKVIIESYPVLGGNLITKEEKKGLTVTCNC